MEGRTGAERLIKLQRLKLQKQSPGTKQSKSRVCAQQVVADRAWHP